MNLKDPKTPMGTVVLLVVFIIMLVGLWANAYFIMLARGVTQ